MPKYFCLQNRENDDFKCQRHSEDINVNVWEEARRVPGGIYIDANHMIRQEN